MSLLTALATTEAKLAKNMSNVDSMKEAHKDLESELKSTKAQLQASRDTLAAVVMEKQRLVNETVELKAVCEELMAMVEGNAPADSS